MERQKHLKGKSRMLNSSSEMNAYTNDFLLEKNQIPMYNQLVLIRIKEGNTYNIE